MKKLTILIILLVGLLCLSSVRAQTTPTTTLFLTWQSSTYVPEKYPGKALVTPGSNILLSIEALSGRQLVSLRDKTVRWYVQGHLAKSGLGLQSFATPVNLLAGNDLRVRVELPDLPGGSVSRTVVIRVVSPKVVIAAPFPNLRTTPQNLSVRAIPYFFSVFTENSLDYSWLVNGRSLFGDGDPQTVSVSGSLPPESKERTLVFRVSAENTKKYLDKAESSKTIVVSNASQ